jgi:hypothetical protein
MENAIYETTTTAGMLAGMLQFCGKKDPRKALNGVYLCASPNGAPMMVATNGNILGAMPLDAGDAAPSVPVVIPIDLIAKIKTTPRNGGDAVKITVEYYGEESVFTTLEHNGATFSQAHDRQRFPEFWRIVPTETSGEVGQFASHLLSAFTKAAGYFMEKAPTGYEVFIAHNGRNGAARVYIPAVPEFVGVIMPYKNDNVESGIDDALPFWAREQDAETQAAMRKVA